MSGHPTTPRPRRPNVPEWFESFREIVRAKVGFELGHRPTLALLDTFESRRRARGNEPAARMLAHLRQVSPTDSDWAALVNAFTVKKTHFFRDRTQFAGLRELICRRHAEGRRIKVWCAGCSTGEEPYSIAMIVHDLGADAEILGTDINTDALATGRQARYTEMSLGEMPESLRGRHMHALERGYVVAPAVARRVRFAYHNLVDPEAPQPQTGGLWDVVLCRNVLIYFAEATIERVTARLRSALPVDGRLVLGAGESLHGRSSLFDLVPLGESFAYRPVPIGERRRAPSSHDALRPSLPMGARVSDAASAAEVDRYMLADNERRKSLAFDVAELLDVPAGEASHATTYPAPKDVEPPALDEFERRFLAAPSAALRETLVADMAAAIDRSTAGDQAGGWLSIGNAWLRLGKLEAALDAYRRAESAQPLCHETHYLVGMLHKRAGAPGPAIQSLRRALFLEPRCWPAAFHLASLYEVEGKLAPAAGEYANALKSLNDVIAGVTPPIPFRSYLLGADSHERFAADTRDICAARLNVLRIRI